MVQDERIIVGFAELFLIGVGLSMDAFAVSVCKGLGMSRLNMRQAAVISLFFGGFQALMPLIGWALGSQLADLIKRQSGRSSERPLSFRHIYRCA